MKIIGKVIMRSHNPIRSSVKSTQYRWMDNEDLRSPLPLLLPLLNEKDCVRSVSATHGVSRRHRHRYRHRRRRRHRRRLRHCPSIHHDGLQFQRLLFGQRHFAQQEPKPRGRYDREGHQIIYIYTYMASSFFYSIYFTPILHILLFRFISFEPFPFPTELNLNKL